jgi:hypothetical protein
MKKLLLISFLLVGIVLSSMAQITPVKRVRIATRTTTFDQNLPAGTEIYCVSDSTHWVVGSDGVASTATIATAYVASTIKLEQTKIDVNPEETAYNIIIDSLKATAQTVRIDSANTEQAGVLTVYQYNKLVGLSDGAGVMQSDQLEVDADALPNVGFVTITATPKDTTGITVSLNGSELKHMAGGTGQWWIGTPSEKKIYFAVPIYKYDVANVIYTK